MKIEGEIRDVRFDYDADLESYCPVITVKTKHGYLQFAVKERLSFDQVRLGQQQEMNTRLKGKSVVVNYAFSLFGHLFGAKSIEILHVS